MAELHNQDLVDSLDLNDRFAAGKPGQVLAKNIRIDKFLAQANTYVIANVDKYTAFVTVGTGGRFPTVKSAYDAGYRLFNILSNISETEDFGVIQDYLTFISSNKSITFNNNVVATWIKFEAITVYVASGQFQSITIEIGIGSTLTHTGGTFAPSFSNIYVFGATASTSVVDGFKKVSFYVHNANLSIGAEHSDITIIEGSCTLTVNAPIGYINCRQIDKIFAYVSGSNVIGYFRLSDGGYIRNVRYNTPTLAAYINVIVKYADVENCDLSYLTNSVFVKAAGCNFVTSHSISGNVEMYACEFTEEITLSGQNTAIFGGSTNGLIIAGTSNIVEGGKHGAISITGNNNSVINNKECLSITLGAVVGCNVTGNGVKATIPLVFGNNIHTNTKLQS